MTAQSGFSFNDFAAAGHVAASPEHQGAPMEVTLYSDGSSRGNPGPGGYGTILRYTAPSGAVHEKELSAGFSCTTNNRMELLGCIVGLEALKRPCTVTVYSDSQYLVNAFNQNWVAGWLKRGWKNSQKQPVKNVDLWKRLLAAKEPHTVKFVWVKGHAGHRRERALRRARHHRRRQPRLPPERQRIQRITYKCTTTYDIIDMGLGGGLLLF